MVPSPSRPAQSEISAPPVLTPSPSQVSALSSMDTEQMFRLIDSILPFEACLYYQFLPLALEGKHLRLGMVTPQDSSARDYVRHILAYLNCSLKIQPITADVHQAMLSAYLNHIHTSSSPRKATSKDNYQAAQSQATNLSLDGSLPVDSERDTHSNHELRPISSQPIQKNSQRNSLDPAQTAPSTTSEQLGESESRVLPEASPTTPLMPVGKGPSLVETPPPLEVQAIHLSRPIHFIATLPPQQLLQELLGRVLVGGIGRLYFERQPECGRILWSQEGVLQSVLEGLALPLFKGVLIELKRFLHLPLLPVIQPKQVELEQRYHQENLLLRLRVMPGTYGEEATLQVLRGVALKFYHRQKLEKLSQDALNLAQQLQQKLDEIRDRSCRHSIPLEALPALNQILHGLDTQVEALTALQINQFPDNPAS